MEKGQKAGGFHSCSPLGAPKLSGRLESLVESLEELFKGIN